MKRNICVKQRDVTDCGAACLASVAAYYNLQVPVSRIRQYAGTDQKGTNVLGLIEAAEQLGLEARGAKGSAESLEKIPLPAILHLVVKNSYHHYVVVYKAGKKIITLMDPATGRIAKQSKPSFLEEWSGIVVLLEPGSEFKEGDKTVSNLNRFLRLVAPHKTMMIQALVGALVYTVLGLASSVYVQKIVDHVLADGNIRLLNLLSVVMVVLLLFQGVIGIMKSVFALQTGQRIDARLILGYYQHILHLPQRFFDTMRVGEIISRVNDAVKIRTFINDTAITLVVNVMIIIFSVLLMFMYYWKLALIMVTIIPVYFVLFLCSDYYSRTQQRRLMEDGAALETQLVESLNAAGTIKRFGIEKFTIINTGHRFYKLLKSIYKAGITALYIGHSSELITRLYTIALLWAGSYFVINRELSPGELLSFYALIGYLTAPAAALVGANRSIRDALIAADRLYEIIDLEAEVTVQRLIQLDTGKIGDIRFDDVAFRYGTRTTVFKALSLTIKAGESTAIVGESGSGKSTIAALLQRLYTVTSGSIHIGQQNINHVDTVSLRKLIAIVPQDIELFAGTILENIALGFASPDFGHAVEVSRITGLHDFVQGLPMHYHTVLSEQGVNLSGGQKQKLALARALYRDPAILILDEATSNLDSNSEIQVQEALDWFRAGGKTIIVIAHRLRTVRNCDRILVLEKGKLVETGTHRELMEASGNYARMWAKYTAD
ncbi:MAG: peptidase domain-containing ABC transporter [Chitinophagaceae bacterium]|nr:MAG: peptidase domain-containing ABC transporter [Chitinophagaceae bacterium]